MSRDLGEEKEGDRETEKAKKRIHWKEKQTFRTYLG